MKMKLLKKTFLFFTIASFKKVINYNSKEKQAFICVLIKSPNLAVLLFM